MAAVIAQIVRKRQHDSPGNGSPLLSPRRRHRRVLEMTRDDDDSEASSKPATMTTPDTSESSWSDETSSASSTTSSSSSGSSSSSSASSSSSSRKSTHKEPLDAKAQEAAAKAEAFRARVHGGRTPNLSRRDAGDDEQGDAELRAKDDGEATDQAAAAADDEPDLEKDPFAIERAEGYGDKRLLVYSVLDGPSADLDEHPIASRIAGAYLLLITICILLSIAAFLVSSTQSNWGREHVPALDEIEIFVVTIFTADYLARLVLTPYPRFKLPYAVRCGRVPPGEATRRDRMTGFLWMFMNQVDFWSVAPFYVEIIIAASQPAGAEENSSASAFAAVRVLRLFRLARILKVGKYVQLLQTVAETLARSVSAFLLLVFSVVVTSLIMGALVFYAENFLACTYTVTNMETGEGIWLYESGDASPYQSVLDGMYWAVITLTTVGYGDKFPLSWLGQMIASATVLLGLVVLAFPGPLCMQRKTAKARAYTNELCGRRK